MCFVRCLTIPVLTMAEDLWLSHYIYGAGAFVASLLGVPLTSSRSCIGHLASLVASEHAMYSASRVDAATRSCFRDCREMEPLPCNRRCILLETFCLRYRQPNRNR